MPKSPFRPNREGLQFALDRLIDSGFSGQVEPDPLPDTMPEVGLGEIHALETLAPHLLDGAEDLGAPTAFAHMDPPTPWISWAVSQWTASRNQNLLHPATSPKTRAIERLAVKWLAPCFGMNGGHMTPGASLANLTALWAAREERGVTKVLASHAAHLSVRKAADILGLDYGALPTRPDGTIDIDRFPSGCEAACLVLTAGTTATGAIDPLHLACRTGWTHVDAAWAGPLRLTDRHSDLLAGIERADSVCLSAHKWLFQAKESAFVLFADEARANDAISYGGDYLAAPNIGLQGSHGAMAAPLVATLMALGRKGIADLIEDAVAAALQWAGYIERRAELELWARPVTGIVVWRPRDPDQFDAVARALPPGSTSEVLLLEKRWFRNVAANPNLDLELLSDALDQFLD